MSMCFFLALMANGGRVGPPAKTQGGSSVKGQMELFLVEYLNNLYSIFSFEQLTQTHTVDFGRDAVPYRV